MLKGKMIKRTVGTVAALSLLCTGAFAADAGEIVREGTLTTYHELDGTYAHSMEWDDGTQGDELDAVVVETPADSMHVEDTAGATTASGKPEQTDSTEQAVSKTVIVSVDALSVRTVADVSGVEIGKVYMDDTVAVVAETGSWYKIRFDGGYGYICKRYTFEDDAEAPANPEEPAGDDVEAGDVNPAELEPSSMDLTTDTQADVEAVVTEPDELDAPAKRAAATTQSEPIVMQKASDGALLKGISKACRGARDSMDAVSARWYELTGSV